MILAIRKASDQQIRSLLDDPEKVICFIYGPETEAPRSRFSLLSLFKVWRIPAEPMPEHHPELEPPAPGDMLDIDKAWHGIHFLLTGTTWDGSGPLSFIVNNGQNIGDVDVGYGPARAFSAARTREIYLALKSVSLADLRAAYDPEKFAELDIYPDIWEDADEERQEGITYLLEHFSAMRKFIGKIVSEDKGMIVFLF